MNQEHKIVLYQVEDTNIYVNVMFKEDTFWMTQKAMADLFECTTDNISLHLKNIYKEEELDENRTTEFFSVVQNEGQRNVKRKVKEPIRKLRMYLNSAVMIMIKTVR